MTAAIAPRSRQGNLPFANTWGGKREGAGRKRRNGKPRVPHVARPLHKSRFPLHVTVRVRAGLPSLRGQSICECIVEQIGKACRRFLRILHFSVQSNHMHFLVEAADRRCLGRGMKGFGVRVARRVNSLLSIRGRFLAERYHARTLRTPREVRNALVYVLFNRRKHRHDETAADPCTSSRYFDGWQDEAIVARARGSPADWPVARADTWLVTRGWKRLGLLRAQDHPRLD